MSIWQEKIELEEDPAAWQIVESGSLRTTPPRIASAAVVIPELGDWAKTAIRLHPRYNPNVPVNASKLGGQFLWPAKETWPFDDERNSPWVAIMQLRRDDVPEMPFPDGKDLFQWLWKADFPLDNAWPVEHKFYWRDTNEIGNTALNPSPGDIDPDFVPFPCSLRFESIQDYPPWELLSEDIVQKILQSSDFAKLQEQVGDPDLSEPRDFYQVHLGPYPGTKVGGYPYVWEDSWTEPSKWREHVSSPDKYFLTLAEDECRARPLIWTPQEDQPAIQAITDFSTPQAKSTVRQIDTPHCLFPGGDFSQIQLYASSNDEAVKHIENSI